MVNKNGFTGKIIYPVVIVSDSKIDVKYLAGARNILNPWENISLAIEAHEKTNGSYDILMQGRLVAKAKKFVDVIEIIRDYIDSKTGRLKDSGLEGIAKKVN